ncbi:MAG: glycosyltransferase family 2 protein [Actinomycetota bacterium]|nr:glycosyltransferase family 2 protein [Actinomycetota bacterium]
MTSIVIAAHNEAAVIGRCLDELLADSQPHEFEVVVVANGCTDRTADVARQRSGVRVIELARPGKSNALNAGDTAAGSYPRVYLDADILVTTAGMRRLRSALVDATDPPLAAYPRRELDVRGRPLLVRAYYAVSSRLPAYESGLFGRGLIMLSEVGRRRFDVFPEMIADDLFLDAQFRAEECQFVSSVGTRIATPLHTRDLVNRLVRVRRGNAAMRLAARDGDIQVPIRAADRMSWLRDVVVPLPWLAPAATVYVVVTVWAALRARRPVADLAMWERDESTRVSDDLHESTTCAR